MNSDQNFMARTSAIGYDQPLLETVYAARFTPYVNEELVTSCSIYAELTVGHPEYERSVYRTGLLSITSYCNDYIFG